MTLLAYPAYQQLTRLRLYFTCNHGWMKSSTDTEKKKKNEIIQNPKSKKIQIILYMSSCTWYSIIPGYIKSCDCGLLCVPTCCVARVALLLLLACWSDAYHRNSIKNVVHTNSIKVYMVLQGNRLKTHKTILRKFIKKLTKQYQTYHILIVNCNC